MDYRDELEARYGKGLIAWGVSDIVENYLEKKADSDLVTLAEVRQIVIDLEFAPGAFHLHRDLALRDPAFVRYLFEGAKEELESDGFVFESINTSTWRIRRPSLE